MNVEVKVQISSKKGVPESQEDLPEFNGGANGEPEVQPELPEFNGGVNGEQQDGDNKPQPTQTVDAQVAPSQNQAVLPNTGTKADRATGALGALSLLGAFGLLFSKKKKDDEEETRNN